MLGIVLTATATIKIRTENIQNPKSFKMISDTATTTKIIAEKFTHFLDSEFVQQGTCVKIKDLDGNGYTFLTTNKGVGIFSLTSCE